MKLLTTAGALIALAGATSAQTLMNEIYASHTGTDTEEFIELFGTPGASLNGMMVLIVEGDSTNAGTLDRVWDLNSMSLDANGFFVLGNTTIIAGLPVGSNGLDIGASNNIENGTDTFYLINTDSAGTFTAALGTLVDQGGGVTSIPTTGVTTIVDIIAMVDTGFGTTDFIYDGATPIGPDGTFLPAGILRCGDAPMPWDPAIFLDFDPFASPGMVPPTPGAPNASCSATGPFTTYCSGDGSTVTACPCANFSVTGEGCANSTGLGGRLTASGSASILAADMVATASQLPTGQFGIMFSGTNNPDFAFGDGVRCVGQNLSRSAIMNSGAGGVITVSDVVNSLNGTGQIAGATMYLQAWFRDPTGPCGNAFNVSNGLSYTLGN